MKADLKNPKEIAKMQAGGVKLAQVLAELIKSVRAGQTLMEIENQAWQLIEKQGGKPGFAMVPGYKWATCLNLNEGIVHGIPNDTVIKPQDLLTIDIGMFYQGFHTDMSYTFQVETQKDKKVKHFLDTGKKALQAAIKQVKPGNRIGHISQAMQTIVEAQGYSCMTELTGHGIGRQLHEYPFIPCILQTDIDQTPIIKPGMTLAIEVLYAQGKADMITDPQDGWTIRTQDGKMAAVFEKTIAVIGDGCLILTPHDF